MQIFSLRHNGILMRCTLKLLLKSVSRCIIIYLGIPAKNRLRSSTKCCTTSKERKQLVTADNQYQPSKNQVSLLTPKTTRERERGKKFTKTNCQLLTICIQDAMKAPYVALFFQVLAKIKARKVWMLFFCSKDGFSHDPIFLRLTLQQKNLFLSWLGLVLEYLSVSLLLAPLLIEDQ